MKSERPKEIQPKDIFEKYREGERFELEGLSEGQLRSAFEYFKNNLENFKETAQAEMLEQFLLYGVPSEEEAEQVVRKLPEERRGVIGGYIGKAIEPGLYNRAFYACWDYLDFEQKSNFKEKFLQGGPESILRIAPFVDLKNYVEREGDEKEEKSRFIFSRPRSERFRRWEEKPRVSLLEKHFSKFEDATHLIESCLSASEYGNLQHQGLRSAIEHYSKKQPQFLYSYIPRFLKDEVISEAEAKEVLLKQENFLPFFSGNDYLNKEEEEKQKAVLRRAKRMNPSKDQNEEHIEYLSTRSERLIGEHHAIQDQAVKRGLKKVFGNFSEYGGILSPEERESFLLSLGKQAVPVFYVAKELGMTREEVKSLMVGLREEGEGAHLSDLSDLKSLIDYGMEDQVVSEFLLELADDGENANLVRDFIRNVESSLQWFSPPNREKLVGALNSRAPYLWFHKLDYAIKGGVISFEGLVEAASKDGWTFVDNYYRILNQAVAQERAGAPSAFDKEKIREMGRNILMQQPEIAAAKPWLLANLFSKDEQERFIMDNLKEGGSSKFVSSALHELRRQATDKEHSKKAIIVWSDYKKELSEAVKASPDMVSNFLANEIFGWESLGLVLSPEERFSLLFGQLKNLELSEVLDNGSKDLVLDLAEHPRYFRKLINELSLGQDVQAMAVLTSEIDGLLRGDAQGREKDASEYDRKKILDDKVKGLLAGSRTSILSSLKAVCLERKFLVFNEEILKIKDPELMSLAEKEVGEYLRLFPEFLSHLDRYVSIGRYQELVEDNLRVAAFLRGTYNTPIYREDSLDEETLRKIRELNPLDKILSRKILDRDFYELVLEELSDRPFLELYKNQLQKIAKEEQERNGPRKRVEYFSPNKEFADLVTRIAMLGASPAVTESKDVILGLPERDREEMMRVLEFILGRGLDRGNADFKSALAGLSGDSQSSKDLLMGIISGYAGEVFESDYGDIRKLGFDIDAIGPLIIYYTNTVKRSSKMKDAFHSLMKQVLAGNYENWRMWGGSPGGAEERKAALRLLKEKELLPSKLSLEQYEKWVSDDSMDFEEIFELEERDIRSAVRKVFEQAVADRHVKKDDLPDSYDRAMETYTAVCLPMREWTEKLGAFKKKTSKQKGALTPEEEAEYKKLQVKIADYRSENSESIDLAEANLYLSRLARLTIKELGDKALDIDGKSVNFPRVFKVLEKTFARGNQDFYQDIRRLQGVLYDSFERIFGEARVSRSKLAINDRVNLKTYIRIGEEPVESCQNYNSSSRFNSGLLSYVTDPNVKIIQLFDEGGRIIARSILRVLGDEEGTPQLFLERVYSTNPHHKIGESIRKFAKAKAAKMGVGLYSHSLEGVTEGFWNEDLKRLVSRNSRNSHVYTDAGGGLMKDGKYTINGAARLG